MALGLVTVKVPEIVRGYDAVLNVALSNPATGTPLDLTTVSEINAYFVNTDSTCLHKRLTTNGVVIVSAVSGKFQIILTKAETALLALSAADADTNLEMRLTIAGKDKPVLIADAYQVIDGFYPNC